MAGIELSPTPYAGNTDNISTMLLTPTNVKDGIKSGAFQGSGYLGRGGGIYIGDVYPYSFSPNMSETPLLEGTIPGNATVYLPLGSINFSSFTGFVTLRSGNDLTTGKCIELDYERNLRFETDQNCDVTISSLDIYFRKTVCKKSFDGTEETTLEPCKFVNSIKVVNKSSSTLNYVLSLGLSFGLPYNMLYGPTSFVKNVIYHGYPLLGAANPPSETAWIPDFLGGWPLLNDDDQYIPPDITTGLTRPQCDFSPLFGDTSPLASTPFNGERIVTIFTQHYGFGNLPPFAKTTEQMQWLNGNDATVIGATPYAENFQTWVN